MTAEKIRKSILQAAIEGRLTNQLDDSDDIRKDIEKFKYYKNRLVKKEKIKDDEIPFLIPNNWIWTRLGYIGESNIGLTYKPSDIKDSGTLVLRSSNIQNGKLDYNDNVFVNVPIPENKKAILNDILICVRNGSKRLVGKAAIIDEENMSFGAFMSIFRTPFFKYVYYYLQSPFFRQDFDGVSTTTINQITQGNLLNRLIPLPPIEEQQRIVRKLKNLLPLISDLEKEEEKLNNLDSNIIERLKTSILLSAVQGTLLDKEHGPDNNLLTSDKKEKPFLIPDKWSWVQLKKLGKLGMGQTVLRREMIKTGIPVYSATIGDVPLGFIKSENNKINLTKGDFVIPARGASIGHVKLINDEEASSTQTTMYFKVDNKEFSPYLYYCLLGMKKYIFVETGTAQPQITVGVTGNQYIPLPPLDVQKEIVKKLDEIFNQL